MNCVNCGHAEIDHWIGRGRCEEILPSFETFDGEVISGNQCPCAGIYFEIVEPKPKHSASDLLFDLSWYYQMQAKRTNKQRRKAYFLYMADKLMHASEALRSEGILSRDMSGSR